jgi:SHS2 domain-containing protein
VQGGVIDPERTARGADPKAVTFHQFALERRDGGWRARVVIDI